MRNNFTADMISEFSSGSFQPILLCDLEFDTQPRYLWNGLGDINFNGKTYRGGGDLLGLSPIEETQDIQAKGLVATLSGVPSNVVAQSLLEKMRGRPFRLYLAAISNSGLVMLEDSSGVVLLEDSSGYVELETYLVNTPYRLFSGLMDYVEYSNDGKTATLRLSVESILIYGQRNKVRRYTHEDQRKKFPNDLGLEFINQLQDKEIVW